MEMETGGGGGEKGLVGGELIQSSTPTDRPSFHFPSHSDPLPGPSQLDVSQGPWGGENCCLLFVLLLLNGNTEISRKELRKRDTVPCELAGHCGSCR